ncbi:hypothetical protein C8R45DRAFT_486140 [Mycena sanguinolenta]|nr:hypothetical protein C8R45DRAFT_486140 [Mycena sanguinolenta]
MFSSFSFTPFTFNSSSSFAGTTHPRSRQAGISHKGTRATVVSCQIIRNLSLSLLTARRANTLHRYNTHPRSPGQYLLRRRPRDHRLLPNHPHPSVLSARRTLPRKRLVHLGANLCLALRYVLYPPIVPFCITRLTDVLGCARRTERWCRPDGCRRGGVHAGLRGFVRLPCFRGPLQLRQAHHSPFYGTGREDKCPSAGQSHTSPRGVYDSAGAAHGLWRRRRRRRPHATLFARRRGAARAPRRVSLESARFAHHEYGERSGRGGGDEYRWYERAEHSRAQTPAFGCGAPGDF